ncbi:chromate efflux transporter [Macrococcus equi]|uniref:chromate efflux transporter n=1 Tax=Macrococcus equi TaxID=3395462 RepID=UPI0039BEA3DC
MGRLLEIFLTALKLGVTSFGGPTAHLGYFRAEYVERRKWLTDKMYQDLVSLCQFLPGPASSQVGIGIGLMRGGVAGAILAFLGFTLPSVIALILAVYFLNTLDIELNFLKGLLIVAIAVVLHALIGMGKNTLRNLTAVMIFIICFFIAMLFPTAYTQILIIIASGITGMVLYKVETKKEPLMIMNVSKRMSILSLILLFILMVGLPIIAQIADNNFVHMIDRLFRGGLLVFGGGHVVLPLLQSAFVPDLLDLETFLSGYGLTQAMPGPLFTFGSFIGASLFGVVGGLAAMIAIFLPAFLLIIGTLPFWATMREHRLMKQALKGINAGVLGILAAAWVNPIIMHTVTNVKDGLFSVILFSLLHFLKCPPWVIVLLGIVIGVIFYR